LKKFKLLSLISKNKKGMTLKVCHSFLFLVN
jgi:hypothetical protein